jgi:hypothetical protein
MQRKIAVVLFLLGAAAAGQAQTLTKAGIATQFNQWKALGTTNLVAGANTLVPIASCAISAGSVNTYALAASTPIKINDPGNPAIDEIITPTVVVQGGACTATFTTTNAHPAPWYITSGTFGLQEAINATVATGVMNTVVIDSAWFNAGGTAKTIYGAAGSPYVSLLATSLTPYPTYRWNGTNYIPTYSLLGIALPATGAGAAAGSSPTVTTSTGSSGNIWTANVTSGTATTTGTLFTETVGTAPPSGNMQCTLQSVGANTPPAFTVSITGGVLTASVAVAPAVSTAYVFAGACD